MESVDLLKVPVFMDEETSLSIGTEALSEELLTVFLLVFVDDGIFSHYFLFSMGKLALVSIPAAHLGSPVLAHFSLIQRDIFFIAIIIICIITCCILELLGKLCNWINYCMRQYVK